MTNTRPTDDVNTGEADIENALLKGDLDGQDVVYNDLSLSDSAINQLLCDGTLVSDSPHATNQEEEANRSNKHETPDRSTEIQKGCDFDEVINEKGSSNDCVLTTEMGCSKETEWKADILSIQYDDIDEWVREHYIAEPDDEEHQRTELTKDSVQVTENVYNTSKHQRGITVKEDGEVSTVERNFQADISTETVTNCLTEKGVGKEVMCNYDDNSGSSHREQLNNPESGADSTVDTILPDCEWCLELTCATCCGKGQKISETLSELELFISNIIIETSAPEQGALYSKDTPKAIQCQLSNTQESNPQTTCACEDDGFVHQNVIGIAESESVTFKSSGNVDNKVDVDYGMISRPYTDTCANVIRPSNIQIAEVGCIRECKTAVLVDAQSMQPNAVTDFTNSNDRITGKDPHETGTTEKTYPRSSESSVRIVQTISYQNVLDKSPTDDNCRIAVIVADKDTSHSITDLDEEKNSINNSHTEPPEKHSSSKSVLNTDVPVTSIRNVRKTSIGDLESNSDIQQHSPSGCNGGSEIDTSLHLTCSCSPVQSSEKTNSPDNGKRMNDLCRNIDREISKANIPTPVQLLNPTTGVLADDDNAGSTEYSNNIESWLYLDEEIDCIGCDVPQNTPDEILDQEVAVVTGSKRTCVVNEIELEHSYGLDRDDFQDNYRDTFNTLVDFELDDFITDVREECLNDTEDFEIGLGLDKERHKDTVANNSPEQSLEQTMDVVMPEELLEYIRDLEAIIKSEEENVCTTSDTEANFSFTSPNQRECAFTDVEQVYLDNDKDLDVMNDSFENGGNKTRRTTIKDDVDKCRERTDDVVNGTAEYCVDTSGPGEVLEYGNCVDASENNEIEITNGMSTTAQVDSEVDNDAESFERTCTCSSKAQMFPFRDTRIANVVTDCPSRFVYINPIKLQQFMQWASSSCNNMADQVDYKTDNKALAADVRQRDNTTTHATYEKQIKSNKKHVTDKKQIESITHRSPTYSKPGKRKQNPGKKQHYVDSRICKTSKINNKRETFFGERSKLREVTFLKSRKKQWGKTRMGRWGGFANNFERRNVMAKRKHLESTTSDRQVIYQKSNRKIPIKAKLTRVFDTTFCTDVEPSTSNDTRYRDCSKDRHASRSKETFCSSNRRYVSVDSVTSYDGQNQSRYTECMSPCKQKKNKHVSTERQVRISKGRDCYRDNELDHSSSNDVKVIMKHDQDNEFDNDKET